MSLRIIFAGTPDFAAQQLQALIDDGKHEIIAVLSQPDRKSGRGKKILATPVKQVAIDAGIPVLQPESLKQADIQSQLRDLNADLMVVVAYGMLLPQAVLDIPGLGCINVHASILPRWRGAAPIERAIEAGDAETGITIMQMDIGLDTGDMLNIKRLPILSDTTGDTLRQALSTLGQPALIETIDQLAKGTSTATAQSDDGACYAKKLTKSEALIDWNQAAISLDQKIRAFESSNRCYSLWRGERIKIGAATVVDKPSKAAPGTLLSIDKHGLLVACAEGQLLLTELQLPNAKMMNLGAILNGKRDYFIALEQFDAHEQ